MNDYVKQQVKQCLMCTFNKKPSGKPQDVINCIPVGLRPFEIVHIDFLGPFPTGSKQNNHVLVLIDNLTKFVRLHAYPTTTARYVSPFFQDFGNEYMMPRRVIMDRGTCFKSSEFTQFCKNNIKHTLTCVQRPQANGQCERINRVLIPAIASHTEWKSQWDWDALMKIVHWDTNATPSKTAVTCRIFKVGWFQQNCWPKASQDKKHCTPTKSSVGDVVVVRRLSQHTGEPTKSQAKYRGPLVIMAVLPSDVY